MKILDLVHTPIGKSAKAFKTQLSLEIRAEFEHNLTQQIYISNAAWVELVRAKEHLLALVNLAEKEMELNSTGIDLSKNILTRYHAEEEDVIQKAIIHLKGDLTRVFKV